MNAEDKELRITEHIAELRKRALRVFLVFLLLFPALLYFSPKLIQNLWWELVKEEMFAFNVLEWILLNLTFSIILSLILLYPYAIFEIYQFAKPGLYGHERRFLKSLLLPSYALFLLGLMISYKIILPLLFSLSYGDPFFSVERTMSNALRISFTFAISLQIPLAVFMLDRFRIATYETLRNLRLPVYLLLTILILNSSTDFSGFAQIATLITLGLMFELGLTILKFSKRYIDKRF
ncbi:MAG: twin-arginine translocase subunit TatC [Archaeoglobaceae archaeon]